MSSLVDITFIENPAGVYFSGQSLAAKVRLVTNRTKTIRGIYITLQGHARVRWVESSGGGKTVIAYTAREEFFKSRSYVMGRENGDSFSLEAGKYEFDFQIQLPSEAPTSFRGLYGKIKYQVTCTIERPLKFDNVFKQPFTVVRPIDFNLQPAYLHPVESVSTKSFSKFLFLGNRGAIDVKINSPCGGYVPGQSIPVSISIKNLANVTTYETNASLIQKIVYSATSPFKKSISEKRTVSIQYFGPMENCKEKEYQCSLQIPAVPPSSFSSSNIIEILYNVVLQLKTRGLHRSMNVKLPVTIGTVPYRCNQQNFSSDLPSTSNFLPEFDVLPTYEEAMNLGPGFIDDDEEKSSEKDDYTPLYPMYNNLHIPISFPSNDVTVETKEKL